MSSGEQHEPSKLEVALEVKSLRRIISAYLNYSDAAEEDVQRYERSFSKIPPAHKAFEPPLDMSQEIDSCEHEHFGELPSEHVSGEKSFCSAQCASTSGRTCCSKTDQARYEAQNNLTNNSPGERFPNQEVPMISECVTGSMSLSLDDSKTSESASVNDVEAVENLTELSSISDSNGHVNLCQHDWLDPSLQFNVPLVDVDKVRCIIRNIVRDWAQEGWKEREQCYKPILEELDRLFPSRSKDRPPCCLVPGAGLGRLALEISCLGFVSQGNEFSYYMMICSSYILNNTQKAGEWTIYPWIHSNCNSLSDRDQLRPVSIPDIHPASAGITEGFSMCGGDFIEVYNDPSQEGAWDAVVTCFFLDTAHNIVEYIDIISRILRDGGVWINLGPLLYHFADPYGTEDEMSIELSLEDVKRVAFHYGFQLEREKTIETTYTTNPRSMMQNRYYAAFWTMTKIANT